MRFVLASVQLLAALASAVLLILSLFFTMDLVAEGMGLLALYAVLECCDRLFFTRAKEHDQ
ncbi:hypothetical protein [Trueperella pyogenes]|uniref:Uncharacterized protein n=1 Tax=Trueperella pyogenes TaxID=1661 RepID=A0ABV3NEC6_9ACTO|nr:hypothetical protein [Trueperella pyogenes]AHU90548.1 hypothetical protein CQ11_07100 [Trueperella pyogenes]AJC70375.1 hypothetical protein X956_00585 [Trueperella pyogenes TP8]AWA43786.1 hypothetical protein DBV13_07070 [Trueperella pyogenes]AZR01256.1 hypothetical protein EB776_08025 [Trueperella pyogenes]MDF2419685.1 hypothetical protein [Trueperella pyogenes]